MNIIEEKLLNNEILSDEEVYIFLDYIICSIKEIVKDDKYINKCDLVQGIIGRYLNKLNVINYPCITNKCIMPNVIGHSFIIATINNKNYIIDPTFIQFKYLSTDDLYINHLRVKSKSPYYYAININKELTNTLINKGYIILNEETGYFYGNSFYNTLTNIYDNYILNNINGKIYVNSFLKGNEILRNYGYEEINTNLNKKCK